MFDFLDLILPRRCVLCDRTGRSLCIGCLAALPPAPDLAPPPGFTDFASLLSYEGDTRALVRAIKYGARRDAIELPARVLSELVDWRVDRVTWAPTSAARRRRRGYDQAESIARAVADQLGVPCVATLSRDPGRGHQTGRSRAERLEGASFHYRGGRPGRSMGAVLLVDDIRTTGATLCAAGDALLDGGVRTISAATIAVTP